MKTSECYKIKNLTISVVLEGNKLNNAVKNILGDMAKKIKID